MFRALFVFWNEITRSATVAVLNDATARALQQEGARDHFLEPAHVMSPE